MGEYRNVLLVPGEDVDSGSLLAAAEADLVINVRGTVVKDRYGPCGRQANDDAVAQAAKQTSRVLNVGNMLAALILAAGRARWKRAAHTTASMRSMRRCSLRITEARPGGVRGCPRRRTRI
jgi:hypothetical protein